MGRRQGRVLGYLFLGLLLLLGLALLILLSSGGASAPPQTQRDTLTPTPPPSASPVTMRVSATPRPTGRAPSPDSPAPLDATRTAQADPGSESGDEPTPQPNETSAEEVSAQEASPSPSLNTGSGGSGASGGPGQAITEVASIPLALINASGDIIGSGRLRIMVQERVTYPESAVVTLRLSLEEVLDEPIAGVMQLTPQTRPPSEATDIPPISGNFTDAQLLQVFNLMGASLSCTPRSFEGCDKAPNQPPDPSSARPILQNSTTWSWTLSPAAEARGVQALTLDIWNKLLINGVESANILRSYPLRIEVLQAQALGAAAATTSRSPSDDGGLRPLLLGAGLGLLALLGGGGYVLWQRRQRRRPHIFISYRRQSTWAAARTIHDRLQKMGAQVFIDVDDINEGRFAEVIESNIRACDFFVPVLAPGTLESLWVRREIEVALHYNKRIIPILINNFDLYGSDVPAELQTLTSHNAITLTPEFFEAGIDKLAQFVGLGVEKKA